MVLERFSAATRAWFDDAFATATPAQLGAWEAIASGEHALVIAPTGSGKTLAAFLWSIDRLATTPPPDDPGHRTRVLYLSPLKALGVDVERNLRSPLTGIGRTAARLGVAVPEITVGVRSGDTPQAERRTLARTPPDILITTPESLYLMLTSAARETLRGVETVIVDEVHAVAGSKRGAHLALSLERLDELLPTPAQRIGLSATVRPIETAARFLGGRAPVTIVQPPAAKTFDLTVAVPIEDLAAPPATGTGADDTGGIATGSIWPHVEEAIVDDVLAHRSTIVFVNARRLAERLTGRLNEIYAERIGVELAAATVPAGMMGATAVDAGAPPVLARAHHGSVSREQRSEIEDALKSGELKCVVATSSLELGIDMGAVDLVIQVESPPSVSAGLQRLGRAGHQVGEVSIGRIYPKHRTDLLHASVVAKRMIDGGIEALSVPMNPLDVLAQQTVAACALEPIEVEAWYETVRRSAPFAALPRSAYEGVLDLLAGRYPSDEFAELRPRVVWDRIAGTLTGRPGAQRLAITSGGTIPDRGLFGVFIAGEDAAKGARRVGELDEEMVYESRVNDVFTLGTTSWRILEITHDRVLVAPAFGQPGKVPFWHGDGPGRPAELGRAIGETTAGIAAAKDRVAAVRELHDGLDENAVQNLAALITDQAAATGTVPSDAALVVERFRDELGDWRLVLHSPYGMRVHAPWALAIGVRARERYGVEAQAMAADDGVVLRIPDTESEPPGLDLVRFDTDELERIVVEEVSNSALFAARFRECAARALLLPRRDPGRRSPLWQQRQRAAQLLEVASRHAEFPILLETAREVLQDVYDLPALLEITSGIAQRRIRLVEVETSSPSPFARTLLFGYVAAFLYEGDAPMAERRAAALSIDSTMLGELLGRVELRELLDPDVIAETAAQLQRLAPDRQARDAEGVVDLLRVLGPMDDDEVAARCAPILRLGIGQTLAGLEARRRIMAVRVAGVLRWAAVEDAPRLRDALGTALPMGLPAALLEPVADPLSDLVSRHARTHGPFRAEQVAERLGLGIAVVTETLRRLGADRRIVEGEFTPGSGGTEWCSSEVLRRLRTRSLASLRSQVEPVPQDAYARFLASWQSIGIGSGGVGGLHGVDGVLEAIDQLAGLALPASTWESLVLPARVRDYSPAMLDELTTAGEVIWAGHGELGSGDGWVSLHPSGLAPLTLPEPGELPDDPLAAAVLEQLAGGGAFFLRQLDGAIAAANPGDPAARGWDAASADAIVDAVWSLVWAGRVTNDSVAALRRRIDGPAPTPRARGTRPIRTGRSSARSLSVALAGPPAGSGRWSLLPEPDPSATARAAAEAETLLARHGVVTRGAAMAEGVRGGFATLYRVLASFEERGRARRGYFVEGLGAAQFADGSTVDRLRAFVLDPDAAPPLATIVLAATDPANPYGAALAWPARPTTTDAPAGRGHRPARKAGSLVAMVDGRATVYLERGGRTVLAFSDDPAELAAAAAAIAKTAIDRLGKLRVTKIDGVLPESTALGAALLEAGFVSTPQGVRIRR
jgi:ATP-dependent Lhr-like helicase